MNCEVSKRLLEPYLDSEFTDALQVVELEAHLETCDSCRVELAALRHLRTTLREAAPYYAVPDSLWEKVDAIREPNIPAPAAKAAKKSWWPMSPAYSWVIAAAVFVIFFLRPSVSNRAPTNEFVSAHIRSLQANHLLDVVSTDRHTVKPWFQGKLDFSPQVPELSKEGFPLLGGRLDYIGGAPVAALVYGRAKHRINVFVLPSNASNDPGVTQDGYSVREWIEGGLRYSAVSDVDEGTMISFEGAFRTATSP